MNIYASLEQMGGKALRSIGLARARLHLRQHVEGIRRDSPRPPALIADDRDHAQHDEQRASEKLADPQCLAAR